MVEAAFKQAVARRGARIVALERYPLDRPQMAGRVSVVAQAARAAPMRSSFPTAPTPCRTWCRRCSRTAWRQPRRVQLLGTGLWDDPRDVPPIPACTAAGIAAPDPAGFRNFVGALSRAASARIRCARRRSSYDAVALVAALVKTQGAQRFSEQVLTNPSGFAGIDGVFRFRADGTNERGLAVMRVTPRAAQIVSPPPRSFGLGT